MLVAAAVAAPLLVVVGSFFSPRVGELWEITDSILGDVVVNTAVVAGGVGICTLGLGTALAALVSFYDFPGRRWLDWLLVLPLAMPAYVLVFVLLGQYDADGWLPGAARDVLGVQLPEIRSAGGAIAVLT